MGVAFARTNKNREYTYIILLLDDVFKEQLERIVNRVSYIFNSIQINTVR